MKIPLTKNQTPQMPAPDAAALAHSTACALHIREAIFAAGGKISFSDYMNLVLYAPGLGYYSAGAKKFGADGDFVTAPEISALFGQCVARAIASTITQTKGAVLELGSGSGKLAWDILLALDKLNCLPEKYYLLEISADLVERQRQRLQALPVHLADRLEWLNTLPENFSGAIIANEVLDVLPVHIVRFEGIETSLRGVENTHDGFAWCDLDATADEDIVNSAIAIKQRYLAEPQSSNYETEVCVQAQSWVSALASSLSQGAILLIDYGFRAAEYYHPSRSTGTLMCHYRHFAHTDPFYLPGLQDITAHVDFSAVAHAGMAAGLTLCGYTTQAQFLIQAGLLEIAPQNDDNLSMLKNSTEIQRLVSPAEMGEFFKVIGFSKNCDEALDVFERVRPLPL
jgi:SAM-dependent MidA family methyltransferase